jgi:hypothetical protein
MCYRNVRHRQIEHSLRGIDEQKAVGCIQHWDGDLAAPCADVED